MPSPQRIISLVETLLFVSLCASMMLAYELNSEMSSESVRCPFYVCAVKNLVFVHILGSTQHDSSQSQVRENGRGEMDVPWLVLLLVNTHT